MSLRLTGAMHSTSGIHYDFLAPQRIVFGWQRRGEIGKLARSLGNRAFLVWGSRTLIAQGAVAEISAALVQAGVEPINIATISREPQVEDVDAAAVVLRQAGAQSGDLVIGIGGGSAIDLAKAAAAMATNRESSTVTDYLEGVGRGLQIIVSPLPILAMPTTAGTGSEATKNAVISSYDPPFKKSLRSDGMLPRVVLVDPELSASSPPAITAQTGMDAITQLIESYISCRAKPIPQALAIHGLQLAVPSVVEAIRDGSSRPAREALAHAALLSGLALANSGLGMAHGVAAALGAVCRVPHGLACAIMLPVALRVNRAACQFQYAQLAAALGIGQSTEAASANALVERIERLCEDVGVPRRLSEVGVAPDHVAALVSGSHGNSLDGNPRSVSDAELTALLEEML